MYIISTADKCVCVLIYVGYRALQIVAIRYVEPWYYDIIYIIIVTSTHATIYGATAYTPMYVAMHTDQLTSFCSHH